MLLGGKQANLKQVAVVTRNVQFNRLLSGILEEWKFSVVDDISTAQVVFVERGLQVQEHEGKLVWLTPMPLSEKLFLGIPISLTSLYHLLEEQCFLTPRRHIRVVMETAVDLKIENDWLEGTLTSLSNRGGRIICPCEIPRGKSLDLSVKLAGKTLKIPSEVLYCIPAGDSQGRLQPQVGVSFKFSNENEFEMLRLFVEKTCIESVCHRENLLMTDPCLSWLDMPKKSWL